MFLRRLLAAFLSAFLAFGLLAQQPNVCETQLGPMKASPIAYGSYLESRFRDANQCSGRVLNGKIVFDQSVSNPALACPDLFAWKLFAEAISDQFWKRWAADQQTWPGCGSGSPGCPDTIHPPTAPLPLCGNGSDPGSCCNPNSNTNPGYLDNWNPAKNCPYFPGDHAPATGAETAPIGVLPLTAHIDSFGLAFGLTFQSFLAQEPGRKIRQTMSELVFRNRPMWQFIFENNLYNQEGLAAVFNAANASLTGNPPYHVQSSTAKLGEVDFPIQSIMIKSDWLSERAAIAMGLADTPPHIKLEIRSPVTDNNGTILEKGTHWLVAMHISSKDTPNWVWATFEHISNPGRCDYTGCNDSYGYLSSDLAITANQRRNFTAPKITCDNLPLPSWVFNTQKTYSSGPISAALKATLDSVGIGTGTESIPPSPGDPRWRNYRLKGTQVEFTDSTGRHTRLGNSVTEAGFVNTSSCITCHARASVGAKGSIPLPVGVFTNSIGEQGYAESAFGAPNPAWYNASGNPPAFRAVQTDFVWGVLTALCVDPKFNPNVCSTTLPTGGSAVSTNSFSIRQLIKQ